MVQVLKIMFKMLFNSCTRNSMILSLLAGNSRKLKFTSKFKLIIILVTLIIINFIIF
jgi:hypothetical protein